MLVNVHYIVGEKVTMNMQRRHEVTLKYTMSLRIVYILSFLENLKWEKCCFCVRHNVTALNLYFPIVLPVMWIQILSRHKNIVLIKRHGYGFKYCTFLHIHVFHLL